MNLRRIAIPKLAAVAAISACVGLSVTASGTDQKQNTDPTRFVSHTSLVLVPAVVTDRNGNHVSGLGKEDFTILENERGRKISIFEEVRTEPSRTSPAASPRLVLTNVAAPELQRQRLTILLIDMVNTRFHDQIQARRDLLKLISEGLRPGEPVALMAIGSNGLQVLHGATTDPSELKAIVERLRGEVSDREKMESIAGDAQFMLYWQQEQRARGMEMNGHAPEATTTRDSRDKIMGFESETLDRLEAVEQRFAIELTVRALRQIAETYAGVPGRKSLIWATGGVPFLADDPRTLRYLPSDLLARAWDALSHAQIAVYPLDVSSLLGAEAAAARFNRFQKTAVTEIPESNLEEFAHVTGGRLCAGKTALADCFGKTQRDASQYYLLGFYVGRTKDSGGWKKIAVKTRRGGLQVLARTSYYVPEGGTTTAASKREDMDTAILSPTDFTSIPLAVIWTGRESAGAKVRLSFRFKVPGQGITVDEESHELKMAFAAFAKTEAGGIGGDFVKELEGKLSADRAATVRSQGILYEGQIEVAPGKYTFRFIVRDNLNGRMGTVSAPLEITANTQAN